MNFIATIMSVFMMVPSLFGLYGTDAKDTEAIYRETVSAIGYENTIETAAPQTEIYDMITEHFNSPLPEGKTVKKAIVIGYDGCRADALKYTGNFPVGAIEKMLDDGATLKIGYCGGVNYPAENTQATSTAPGWCSIMTGEWADKHGITGNGITKTLDYKTLMTSLVEDGVIDSSNFVTSWDGHFVDDNSTYKDEKAYCEENGINVAFNVCAEDTASARTVIKDLKQDDCSDFIFAIYEGPDHAGHSFGFSTNNPIYEAGFVLNDILAYRTIKAIENRDTYEAEDWLIIITSDHGGFGTDHGGATIQERMVFILSNKEY